MDFEPQATREKPRKDYSKTVHLPKTEFPMRGDLPKREPQWLAFWEEKGVFKRMLEKSDREGRPPFVLHDGPPFANGHIHIGTALNKILKDIVIKSHSLMGRRTPYIPGWDCHGMPIEHALLKEKKMSKSAVTDLVSFRRMAAEFAEKFIQIHLGEFKRLGVLGEWDRPYRTMSSRYESKILRAFRLLYQKGYIYRGRKTVSWCVTCETALAEAEFEYKVKTSPSVYVAMPILEPSKGFPFVQAKASVLVWTTTPWTLPANMAVAFHPDLEYVLVGMKGEALGEKTLLVAKARLEAVLKALGASGHMVFGSWSGKELVDAGLVCETPFAYVDGFPQKRSKGVLGVYVTAEDGTGIVHTAPGHGADDYNTGVREHLEIFCPVDPAGRYVKELGPAFAGKQIFKDGSPAVIEMLKEAGRLLDSGTVEHNYQHCWRCKNPIAFRATEQWFLNVSHDDLRQKLLQAIGEVRWLPAASQERISAVVGSRPDWCLSRQRLWGTPIPVFWCAECQSPLADNELMELLERKVAAEGSDFWYQDKGKKVVFGNAAAGEALPWTFLPERSCPKCGKNVFHREEGILDVWLDSGTSWLAVLGESEIPCELYLEGSDQHRGWFQSSLVLAVALTGKAPYRTVLTHGFVLDEQGRAMHKSAGNVVSPQEVIGKLGADVLRLWVALADYSDDVRISAKLLEVPTETYRKLRNTLKYLLGNVNGFDPSKDALDYDAMPELERYMLKRLFDMERAVVWAYENFAFRTAARALVDFCNLDLSAFYLDARKDALYTLKAEHPVRRAARTVMWQCLLRIARLAAPIVSYTCEEAWQEMRKQSPAADLEESVFLHDLDPMPSRWDDAALGERFGRVAALRAAVLPALEEKRAKKVIGAPLEAKVTLRSSGRTLEWLRQLGEDQLAEVCIVSQVCLVESPENEAGSSVHVGPCAPGTAGSGTAPAARLEGLDEKIFIRVERAEGTKCPRCWRYRRDTGSSSEDPDLCARCVQQLTV